MTTNEQDFEIKYRQGSPYLFHKVCGTSSFNPRDINDKYCPRCKKFLTQEKLPDFMPNLDIDRVVEDIVKESIQCTKCQSRAYLTTNGYFTCPNGHENAVIGITRQPIPPPKEEKKKRRIEINCPICNKVAEVVEESKVFGKLRRKYTCGHSHFLDLTAAPLGRDEFWNKFFPFQREAIEFCEDADYTALMAHDVGLGKTWIGLGTYRYNYRELLPCLIVCEASKVYDWKEEFNLIVNSKYKDVEDRPIIHKQGKLPLCPGFNNHIVSMSLISKPDVLNSIKEYGFKLAIVDEAHSFKDEDADRTYALQQIAKVIPHTIFLSATPVMNKVVEYFPILNILRPSHFPSKARLVAKCDRTDSGKVLGISQRYREEFFQKTSKYILRRTKKEVGLQLPDLQIHKRLYLIDQNKNMVNQYNKHLDELDEVLNSQTTGLMAQNQILGIFAKLRHITGLLKVKPIIDAAREFLECTDEDTKLAIGVHHKDVMEYIALGLEEFHPICASDEDPQTKMNRINEFKKPENRLAILSILGMGQGHNIQFCKNAIQAERQWNPAKEHQFYGRFHRIVKDKDGNIITTFTEDDSVIIDVVNARATIDEYFDAAVDLKKAIVDSTSDKDLVLDPTFMMELAHKLVKARLQLGI